MTSLDVANTNAITIDVAVTIVGIDAAPDAANIDDETSNSSQYLHC